RRRAPAARARGEGEGARPRLRGDGEARVLVQLAQGIRDRRAARRPRGVRGEPARSHHLRPGALGGRRHEHARLRRAIWFPPRGRETMPARRSARGEGSMRIVAVVALSLLVSVFAARSHAAPISVDFPPGLHVPAAAQPGPGFDVDKATAAYIAMLTPEQRARSDAYFEGGYWLQLWNWLYGVAVAAVALFSGLSRRIREMAERVSRRPWLYTLIYAAVWTLVGFVLSLPFAIYAGFVREHAYGLSEQPFLSWLGDHLKGLGVGVVLGSILVLAVYAALRRAGARWWIWATGIVFVFNVVVGMIGPVFIAPIFN